MSKIIGTSLSKRKDNTVVTLIFKDNIKKSYIGKGLKWKNKTTGKKIWWIFKIFQLKKIAEEFRCKRC